MDFQAKAIWAPTAAHHSGKKNKNKQGLSSNCHNFFQIFLNCLLIFALAGQLSDSACGTLKRCIKNDLKSGKGRTFINCAFFHWVHSNHLKQNSFAFLNTLIVFKFAFVIIELLPCNGQYYIYHSALFVCKMLNLKMS